MNHVITTACEHNSVLRPLYLKEETGTELTIIPADEKGRIRYDLLNASLKPNTAAIVLTHASNLTGNVTDMAFVSDFAKKHGLLLIVDASQTAGSIPINVMDMGIDILCFTGHKGLFGPQGTWRPLSPRRLKPCRHSNPAAAVFTASTDITRQICRQP